MNSIQDSNIDQVDGIAATSIDWINWSVLLTVPTADLIVQVSLADGSWQEPDRPFGWTHFHRDETRKDLVDSLDNESGWTILRNDICQGGTDGENPGLYPTVCEDQMNTSSLGMRTYTVAGLDDSKQYNFEFWSGFEIAQRSWENNNGRTQFTIEGYGSVSILHKGYTGSPVTIEGVYPQGNSVSIDVEAINSATYYYFNVLVIRQFTP